MLFCQAWFHRFAAVDQNHHCLILNKVQFQKDEFYSALNFCACDSVTPEASASHSKMFIQVLCVKTATCSLSPLVLKFAVHISFYTHPGAKIFTVNYWCASWKCVSEARFH